MTTTRSGTLGWAALAAGVVTWDVLAPETLSSAFRRAHGSPLSRALVVGAWSLLTAHLFAVIPEHVDPIHLALHVSRRAARRG